VGIKTIPQRLKPRQSLHPSGTAKAMPFQNNCDDSKYAFVLVGKPFSSINTGIL
jgi:hypothetical protein